MPTTVTITKVLDDDWITDDQATEATDQDIVELVMEDLFEFADGAKFSVKRAEEV